MIASAAHVSGCAGVYGAESFAGWKGDVVRLIARVITEIIPLVFDLFSKELSFERILTSMIVIQLIITCLAWRSLRVNVARSSSTHALLCLLCLWALSCLSVLCWLFGSVVLHRCGTV